MLRWWARPHSAWTTGNNIPWPSHDAYFFYSGAIAAFTLAHVHVDSFSRHKESFQTLILTRRADVADCFCWAKWTCLLRGHCYSTEQDERSVNSYENTLVSNTKFRHMVYDRYIPGIYHLQAWPEPAWHPRENRLEADVSLAFIASGGKVM